MKNSLQLAYCAMLRATACIICSAALLLSASAARASEEPLVIGIFPRYNSTEISTMYAPLAEYLRERLGREKVVVVTSKDFDSFWRGVEEGRFDLVHYNQYHYIRSAQPYRVIAHAQEFGRSAVSGAIFVRRDSGITDVSQLRGRTVIFGGGKDAMMSYIAPRFLMMRAGLKDDDFRTEFAVNPPNALLALFHRQADAAGGGDILIDLPVVKNAIKTGELRMLATTEPLLFLPWAVKRNMPAKQRESLQTLLTELDESPAGQAVLKSARTTAFEKAEDRDYAPHRRMTESVFGARGIAR